MQKIASAFIKAKKAFSPALKDKTNPAFRSKYADLGACLEAVNDALLDNGIAVIQRTFEDASGVTVETVFLHESGETMESGKLHVPASKQDPQGYGSALTYCRRYSLMTACGIAPEDDDGNAATKPRQQTQQAAQQRAPIITPTGDIKLAMARSSIVLDTASAIQERFQADDMLAAYELYSEISDQEERVYLWKNLPSHIRSAIKKHGETLKQPVAA